MRSGLFAPVRALFSDAGSRRMLLVALLWSVTSALGKKGVQLYGAIPFGIVLVVGLLICFAVVTLFHVRDPLVKVDLNTRVVVLLILGGVIMAAAEVTHFVALSLAPVACMIAVKRLSLVFGVILGRVCFQERNIRSRLLGASVMVTGVFVIYH
jgi:uncharacterized membrane protein